jgi:hypothetical protein
MEIFLRQDWGNGLYRTSALLSRQRLAVPESRHFPIKIAASGSKTQVPGSVAGTSRATPVSRQAARQVFSTTPQIYRCAEKVLDIRTMLR